MRELYIPLEAFIDYLGFRLLATAVVPIVIVRRSDSGKLIGKAETLLVRYEFYLPALFFSSCLIFLKYTFRPILCQLGSKDRGDTFKNEDENVNSKILAIGKTLNVSLHGVKGLKDLTPKYTTSPADLRVFKGTDGRYHALNFWRAFPSELHTETPHLVLAPRGMSIFWRFLRPELVMRWKKPLCADGLTCFIEAVPGYEEINNDIGEATRHMIKVGIIAFKHVCYLFT